MAPERFELVDLPGGGKTLRLAATKQVFHPVIGPVAEAERIHLAGTRLVERANAAAAVRRRDAGFVVWDVGLGAAANALTAIRALRRQDPPVARPAQAKTASVVHLCSFDRTLAPLDFALQHAAELGYLQGHEDALRTLAGTGRVHVGSAADNNDDGDRPVTVEWTLHPGDFSTFLLHGEGHAGSPPSPHAVFFDPYSPAANPEMWTLELFAALRGRAAEPAEGGCLLTTYTRSTAVRVTLLLAGWHVGAGAATGEKDETTVAASGPTLLERPLGARWLEKVWASANAAPRRAGQSAEARGPISEEDYAALRAHPQFQGVVG